VTNATIATSSEFRIGSILRRSWDIYIANFFLFLLIAVIIPLPHLLFPEDPHRLLAENQHLVFAGDPYRLIVEGLTRIAAGLGQLAVSIIALIFSLVGPAVILYCAFQALLGRDLIVGDAIRRGLSRFWSILGLGFLKYFGIAIGLLLFVVPGLMLWVRWSAALQACVVEGLGPVASLRRSAEFTTGHRWKIFGILLPLAVGFWLLYGLVTLICERLGVPFSIAVFLHGFGVGTLVWLVVAAIYGAYINIVLTVMYHDLRVAKDGVDTNQITAGAGFSEPQGQGRLSQGTVILLLVSVACLLGFFVWLSSLSVWSGATAPVHARSAGPARGTLLAIGGGVRGLEIQDAAIRFGGKPARWVYIPTALNDADVTMAEPPAFIARSGGTVTLLHTRDRKVADSEAFTAPLRAATAVFIEGGRQWRLVDAYAGTRTETELRAVLDRDGLISGTSAGATIQGSFLVRGSPRSNEILMAPGYERGFGYLSNVAIDQHVRERDREKDLSVVVAAHPGLLGVGLDASAAVIVQGNTMTVIGDGVVWITDGADHGGEPFYTLQPGARFNLATWQVQ
jgi:cyanophycinase